MDIVEFVEKLYSHPLSSWQKEFVEKFYDAVKNNKQLFYLTPRCNSRYSLKTLEALVVIAVAQEQGLIKKEETNE